MQKGDDPYEILGVLQNAELAQIRKAYHKLAVKFHPDKQSYEVGREQAQPVFSKISGAYEILIDKEKRREYDEQQEEGDDDYHPGFDGNAEYDYHTYYPSPSSELVEAQNHTGKPCENPLAKKKKNKRGKPMHFSDPYDVFKRVFEEEFGYEYPGAKWDNIEPTGNSTLANAKNSPLAIENGPSTGSSGGGDAGKNGRFYRSECMSPKHTMVDDNKKLKHEQQERSRKGSSGRTMSKMKTSSLDSSTSSRVKAQLAADGAARPRRSVKRSSTAGKICRLGETRSDASPVLDKSQADSLPRVSRSGRTSRGLINKATDQQPPPTPAALQQQQRSQSSPRGPPSKSKSGGRRKPPLRSTTLDMIPAPPPSSGPSATPPRRARRKTGIIPPILLNSDHRDEDVTTGDTTLTSGSDCPSPAELAEAAAQKQQQSLQELALHSSRSTDLIDSDPTILLSDDDDDDEAVTLLAADAAEAAAQRQSKILEELSSSLNYGSGDLEDILTTDPDNNGDNNIKTKQQKQRKSNSLRKIRFDDNITVHTAIVVTARESDLVWYKEKDLDLYMRTEIQKLNKQKIKGKQAEVCWRGLEHLVNGTDLRKQKNTAYVKLALQFQRDMKLESIDDPEALRTLCRSKTMGDRKRAFTRGTLDAAELMNMELEEATAQQLPPVPKAVKTKDKGFIKSMKSVNSK